MKDRWKFLDKKKIFSDNILDISHHHWEFTAKGVSTLFTSIDTNDWVVIIPELQNGKIALVRQFRPIVNEWTLEFPGGAINRGESHFDAAKRELEEETSLISDQLILLSTMRPNPAIMSNRCYVYLATNCKPDGRYNFDPFEDITVIDYTKSEVESLIRNGEITHSVVLGAYACYKLFGVSNG